MKTAADELSAVYDEFGRSRSFIGLYARFAEGRCYQAVGRYTMALGCYEDIVKQPNVLAAVPQTDRRGYAVARPKS